MPVIDSLCALRDRNSPERVPFAWHRCPKMCMFKYLDEGDLATESGHVQLRSYRGASSYHNSNRMTFLRVPGWRALLATPGGISPYLHIGAALLLIWRSKLAACLCVWTRCICDTSWCL